jgi:hypothetical protein
MPHRKFKDERGRDWEVWSVSPLLSERRTGGDGGSNPTIERRRRPEVRAAFGPQWVNGWLVFETRGEKRRLAPYPANWIDLSDAGLAELCRSATEVTPSRRLIE